MRHIQTKWQLLIAMVVKEHHMYEMVDVCKPEERDGLTVETKEKGNRGKEHRKSSNPTDSLGNKL